jgi:hypothetical protein
VSLVCCYLFLGFDLWTICSLEGEYCGRNALKFTFGLTVDDASQTLHVLALSLHVPAGLIRRADVPITAVAGHVDTIM